MNKNEINIYVVTHKNFNRILNECFPIISVGDKLLSDEKCTYLKDNTMMNISPKNKNYCELTAQYWIWKNDVNSVVKGLCHYRRYFTKDNRMLNGSDIINIFNNDNIDIIVPYKSFSLKTVKEVYLRSGYQKDLDIVRNIIAKKYPDYVKQFDEILKSHGSYPYNMIIAKAEIFNEYSRWLFDILFEAEKLIDMTGYTDNEKRVFGFISERLLAVWLSKNSYRIQHLNVVNTEQHKKSLKNIVKTYINKYQDNFIVKKNLELVIKLRDLAYNGKK